MLLRYSDEFSYCVEYLVTKVGLGAFEKNLLDKLHIVLADYYNRLESVKFTQDQICFQRLTVIDTILDSINLPRLYLNRAQAAEKIFSKYESEVDVAYFLNWLKDNSDNNNETHQALKLYLKNPVDEILKNIESSNKSNWTVSSVELEEIFRPINEYIQFK